MQTEAPDDDMDNLGKQVLCEGISELATSPRGLLDPGIRSALIEKCDMDGINHLPEDFLPNRHSWYATIRGLLEERDVTASAFPPPDLEYLCTLVDGTCGSGLPQHVLHHQYNMLDLAGSSRADRSNTVFIGQASLPGEWGLEDGKIELCIKIGRNNEHGWGGSYLLRYRQSPNEKPAWKYAAHADENASEVYDILEAYLAFYARFNEQDEADIEREKQGLCMQIGSKAQGRGL